MITSLVLTAVALLVGLVALRAFGGRSRADVTTADLAVLLSAGEVGQVLYTLLKIDASLGLPAGSLVLIGVVCLGMVVGGVLVRWMAAVVTGVGLLAAVTDALISDGPALAGSLLLTIVSLWVVIRLLRLIVPR
ncbi:hypothetical protein [Pseudonocardia sp. ICBG1034]|uniref:hypothetical protein n=1 Tax=Pseudonocardia sp. ICBG1034 TaxID=2844381 RepID=UPI001CCE32E0|nr:hypothetical protein [Pseudonocardia sp. ICBG1034]